MTQNNQGSDPRGVDETAAHWAVRLQAGPLGTAEQGELDGWLEADARHRGAFLRAQAAWLDLDRLAALAAHREPPEPEVALPAVAGGHTSRRWFIAAGVGTLTVAGAGAWWLRRVRGEVYVSDVGEVRRVTLADGSSMLLNTATEAAVHFDESRREIQLVRGEGLFEVAKDAARPFIVRVGTVSVRAVGTVFAVRAAGERVDVTVTEGVVEVADTGADPGLTRRVAANEQAVVTEQRAVEVEPIPRDAAERRLAWREGMVAFDGEPLTRAVEEINRHNHRRIVVDDPALAGRAVVGMFRASDADGFAATVATALGAESVPDGNVIHLRPRAAP